MQNRNRQRATTMRLVGALIGEVIDAHEGEAAFGTVESLRRGFVALRKSGAVSSREVARTARAIERVTPETAGIVARAFAAYFAVVNIADEALLEGERRGAPNPRGLDETIAAIQAGGVDFATFRGRIGSLKLMPVFTAHPTEARRQAVQKCHRRMFDLVARLVAADEDAPVRALALDALRAEMSVLWKTSTLRAGKMTVEDEIDNGLRFFPSGPVRRRAADAACFRGGGKACLRTGGARLPRTCRNRVRILDRRRSRRKPERDGDDDVACRPRPCRGDPRDVPAPHRRAHRNPDTCGFAYAPAGRFRGGPCPRRSGAGGSTIRGSAFALRA